MKLRIWSEKTPFWHHHVPKIALVLTVVLGAWSNDPFMSVAAAMGAAILLGSGERIGAAMVLAVLAAGFLVAGFPPQKLTQLTVPFIAILGLVGPWRAIRSLPPANGLLGLMLAAGIIALLGESLRAGSELLLFLAQVAAGVFGALVGQLLATNARRGGVWNSAVIDQSARDLLLGRLVTGMIHDLAQPINVVAMANGNLGYVIDQMPQGEERDQLLRERVVRIGDQAERAAHLLRYFRSFGRSTLQNTDNMTLRGAIELAVLATQSNIRHGGVEVEIAGEGLDCLALDNGGTLEMAVAGMLLSAFRTFIADDGTKIDGLVRIAVRMKSSAFEFTVSCHRKDGSDLPIAPIEPVMEWLLSEVAENAGGKLSATQLFGHRRCYRLTLPR
ncbi:MAG: hypothetical protein ACXIUO_06140 [Erythrobacter sp.]